MTASEFSTFWPDIVALQPQKVIFTGGEPLMRPDILDLLRGLRRADPQHRVLRCLNTNGHLITLDLARQLVGLVDEIRVSLDALEERNDSLRGQGNFEAAVRALECLHVVGFEPKVLVTVTKPILPDLEALLCFLIKKGITRITLNHFRLIGLGKDREEWVVETDAVRRIVQRSLEKCKPSQPLGLAPDEHTECLNCGVGSFLNILPNGDVFPCHVLTQPEFYCGNLRQQSLLEICHFDSLLGELQRLDFEQLFSKDKLLAGLIGNSRCMGTVYAKTKELPILRNNLSLPFPLEIAEPF